MRLDAHGGALFESGRCPEALAVKTRAEYRLADYGHLPSFNEKVRARVAQIRKACGTREGVP